jgi:hypothetical protein
VAVSSLLTTQILEQAFEIEVKRENNIKLLHRNSSGKTYKND